MADTEAPVATPPVVRIEIDHVPDGVTLVAGQTATVQIEKSADSR